MPSHRSSGAWKTCVRPGIAVLILAALLVGVGASRALVAHGAGGSLTLELWPAGQGKIDATQGGASVGSCDFLDVIHDEQPCQIIVSAGTPLGATGFHGPSPIVN